MPEAPIDQLAFATLRGDVEFANTFTEGTLRRALSKYGTGCEHLEGEHVVAYYDEHQSPEVHSRGSQRSRSSEYRWVNGKTVFTDRRALGMCHGTPFEFSYGAIQALSVESGFASTTLHVRLPDRMLQIYCAAECVKRFLDGMAAYPPEARRQPRPIPEASTPEDPTGATAAAHCLCSGDRRMPHVLRLVWESHRRGWMDEEAAKAMVRRALLVDRTLRMGRGTHAGMWLTALPLEDLVPCVAGALECWPSGESRAGEDVVLDFPHQSGGAGDRVAGALLDMALDHHHIDDTPDIRVQGVRLVARGIGGFTAFQLWTANADGWVPLSRPAPMRAETFHGVLMQREARALLLRGVYGVARPLQELEAYPKERVLHDVRGVLGAVDLTGFFADES